MILLLCYSFENSLNSPHWKTLNYNYLIGNEYFIVQTDPDSCSPSSFSFVDLFSSIQSSPMATTALMLLRLYSGMEEDGFFTFRHLSAVRETRDHTNCESFSSPLPLTRFPWIQPYPCDALPVSLPLTISTYLPPSSRCCFVPLLLFCCPFLRVRTTHVLTVD